MTEEEVEVGTATNRTAELSRATEAMQREMSSAASAHEEYKGSEFETDDCQVAMFLAKSPYSLSNFQKSLMILGSKFTAHKQGEGEEGAGREGRDHRGPQAGSGERRLQ